MLPKPPVRRLNLRARGIAETPDYLIWKEVVYSNVRTSYPLARAAVTSAVTLTGGAAILIQRLPVALAGYAASGVQTTRTPSIGHRFHWLPAFMVCLLSDAT